MILAPLEQFEILSFIFVEVLGLDFSITNFLIINILALFIILFITFFNSYFNKSNYSLYLMGLHGSRIICNYVYKGGTKSTKPYKQN